MYLWLKVIHVAAVVIFLGNIITGLFWHAFASRTRDPRLLAHTVSGIIRSDQVFTIPGVAGIAVAGVWAAIVGHYPIMRTPWILWSLILFAISGISFMTRVAPLQRELRRIAENGRDGGSFDWARYAAVTRQWEIWGAVATLAPVAALCLMILKPTF